MKLKNREFMKTGELFMPKWLDLNEVDDDEILFEEEIG